MAERRMFTGKIVKSDPFTEMPLSAQALYFHLNMEADDDGFVNSPNKIRRSIGAAEDDLKLLVAKRFILQFDNGTIVIKHWRMHNLLRKDRYKPTQYQDEMSTLFLKKNGTYTEKSNLLPYEIESGNQMATIRQPYGNQVAPQVSIGEESLVEESKVECSVEDETDNLQYFNNKIILSDNQIGDLIDKMGLEMFDEYCDRLEAFIDKTGANIKCHYATILEWYNKDRAVAPQR